MTQRHSAARTMASGPVAFVLVLAGCASTAASPSGPSASPTSAVSRPSQSATEMAGGGPSTIEGGDLTAGAVAFSDALGVSVQPPDEGWFAVVAGDTDFMITRDRIAVWFVQPASIRPDGTAASTEDAPTDPAAFVTAMEEHPAVTVTGSERFSAGELDGLLVDFESSGMAETSALLVTSDGAAFGFPDGEGRVLLLTTDAGLVMVSVEGGESRDAAWDIVEPLVTSIGAAP